MLAIDAYKAGVMVGTLLLLAAGLGFAVFTIVSIVKAFTRKTRGWIITASLCTLLLLTCMVAGVAAGVAALSRAVSPNAELDQTLVSSDGQFQLTVPSNWKAMPELNPEAKLSAGNIFAVQYVMVLSEPKEKILGELPDFAKTVTQAMVEKLRNPVAGEFEEVSIQGKRALRRRLSGGMEKLNITYHHTSVESDDHFTQIIMWTQTERADTMMPIFDRIALTYADKNVDQAPEPPHAK